MAASNCRVDWTWPGYRYVQSIKLNGRLLSQVWFRRADVANGGNLELQMGNTANEKLGADPATLPPSAMTVNPATLQ